MIYYIHLNPEKHGLVNDFSAYEHSSHCSILSDFPTKLKRDEVIHWFEKKRIYKFLFEKPILNGLNKFEIEV